MAAIIHRCTTCTHPDLFHSERDEGNSGKCSYGACHASPHTFGPPEIIPTWSAGGDPTSQAKPDPTLIEPGSSGGASFGRTCDCEDCWALYRAETAPAGVSA
ncbi:hypothetical protein [Amycolatopsis sp. lyj-108]|uniref:hypothetical protein n=1 Tax=Amycolatopsis sp. lyj-108 TaxID=2789286 RepID=UPI00397E3CB5